MPDRWLGGWGEGETDLSSSILTAPQQVVVMIANAAGEVRETRVATMKHVVVAYQVGYGARRPVCLQRLARLCSAGTRVSLNKAMHSIAGFVGPDAVRISAVACKTPPSMIDWWTTLS